MIHLIWELEKQDGILNNRTQRLEWEWGFRVDHHPPGTGEDGD